MRAYWTVPFNPVITAGQDTDLEVSRLLSVELAKGAQQGWTYQGFESVPTLIRAKGCFGGFSGTPVYRQSGVLVFYKEQ